MSNTQTLTYHFNTRYANAYNSDTKTYTFTLSDPIHNVVSSTLNDFYLDYNTDHDYNDSLFYPSYKNNGFSYEDSITNKLTYTSIPNSHLTYNSVKNVIEIDSNIGDDVYFHQKNDDISNALGFQKKKYSTESTVQAEKYLAKSIIDDNIIKSINGFMKPTKVYNDTNSFFISINDFCHSQNTHHIHLNTNDVSRYIIDKAYMYETITSSSTNKYYTLLKDKKRNTRHYDKVYDIKTLKIQLLHENGSPLNIDLYDFNFEIEFHIV